VSLYVLINDAQHIVHFLDSREKS